MQYKDMVLEYRRLRREGKHAEAEAYVAERDHDGTLRPFAEFADALVAAVAEAVNRSRGGDA